MVDVKGGSKTEFISLQDGSYEAEDVFGDVDLGEVEGYYPGIGDYSGNPSSWTYNTEELHVGFYDMNPFEIAHGYHSTDPRVKIHHCGDAGEIGQFVLDFLKEEAEEDIEDYI